MVPRSLGLVGLAVLFFSASLDAAPAPPRNLRAVVAGSAIFLTWDAPIGSPSPVLYYRLDAGLVPGSTIASSLLPPNPAFTAFPIPAGTYYFRVYSVDGTGAISEASNEVVAIVGGGSQSCASPPSPPHSVAFTVVGNLVTVQWSPGDGCPATYILHAGSAPGLSNVAIAHVGGALSISAAAPPAIYYVRVFAQNAVGLSAASNEVAIAVGSAPQGGTFTGTWIGSLFQPQGPVQPVYNYTLQLVHTGTQVSGTARIDVPGLPQYFAEFVVTGTVDATGVLSLQDLRITNQRTQPGTGGWCIKSLTLQRLGPRLVGNWSAPGCAPGSIDVAQR